jgi:lambda family phage minor tail protein L
VSAISAHRQRLNLGAEVELIKLDLTPIGVSTIFYFSQDYGISFGGQAYQQVPFEFSELERNVTGEMVAPKISLPNTAKFASSLVNQYKDAVGAELTRTKTFHRFLDGQPGADGTAVLSQDVFVIEQKLAMNKVFAQWELRVLADTGDRMLPGRQAMKLLCPYNYRKWDAGSAAFVYPKLKPCPYASGSVFADIHNNPTSDPRMDDCDRRVDGGCVARRAGWPNGVLGFGGFPGISKYRTA